MNLRRIVAIWIFLITMVLAGVSSVWSEDKKPLLQNFEAFQHHFGQNQGRHRLVLLADPG